MPNNNLTVQVSDTTGDDSSNTDRKKNTKII